MKLFSWLILVKMLGSALSNTWKRFPHDLPFVWGIHRFPHIEPVIRNFAIEQTFELSVIQCEALHSCDVTVMNKEKFRHRIASLLDQWGRV